MITITILTVLLLNVKGSYMQPLNFVQTSTGPLGDMFELLDYITEEINSEAMESDRISSSLLSSCDQESKHRSVNILEAQQGYILYSGKFEDCKLPSESLKSRMSKLAQDLSLLKSIEPSMIAKEIKVDYQNAYKTIDSCVELLKDLPKRPGMFLELSKKVTEISVIDGAGQAFSELSSSLAQLSAGSSVDASAISVIIVKLEELKVSLQGKSFDDEPIEAELSQSSVKLALNIRKFIEKYSETHKKLEQQYSRLTVCANEMSGKMKEFEEKEISEAKLKGMSDILCEDWKIEYDEMRQNRERTGNDKESHRNK